MKQLIILCSMILSCNLLQAQATASRLIQQSEFYGGSYLYGDSSVYIYSGNRGGDLQHPINSDTFKQFTRYIGIYSVIGETYNTYDANNNVLISITAKIHGSLPIGPIRNYSKNIYTYDSHNNVLTSISQQWDTIANTWVNVDKAENTYDTANHLLNSFTFTWDTATVAWFDIFNEYYTYDPANNLSSYLSQVRWADTGAWVNYESELYTYTATNKLENTTRGFAQPTGWLYSYRFVYTYDGSDNLLENTDLVWNDSLSVWDSDLRYINTYDGSGNMLTHIDQQKTSDYHTSPWETFDKIINSDFVYGQPQLTIVQRWNDSAFVNISKDTMVYNSYGQLTLSVESDWSSSGEWVHMDDDYLLHYYYETYTTAVNNIHKQNCVASVYPVPAQDVLHVSVTWDEPQAFTTQITDMKGSVVRQYQMPIGKTYTGEITLGNLPQGNYIIHMTGQNAQAIERIVVVK